MMIASACLFFCLFAFHILPCCALFSPSAPLLPSEDSPVIKNAAHIFNAIHSSMRQWGSSLNHNGMSFFPAIIPAGTELYHGRGDNKTIEGMEWLAFEPEHALNFARAIRRRPDGPPRNRPGANPPPSERLAAERHGHEGIEEELSTKWLVGGDVRMLLPPQTQDLKLDRHFTSRGTPPMQQYPLGDKDKDPEKPGPRLPPYEIVSGYLHTFAMKHDLNVIYVDGMSAGKSTKGTLDSQDYILQMHDDHEEPKSPFGDFARARYMCDMATNEWHGRVDGFIRMEHGFELILCDFKKSAEILELKRSYDADRLYRHHFQYEFLKAITARYQGIGGNRVELDYDGMVTAFAHSVDLFNYSSRGDAGSDQLPRLESLPFSDRAAILDELTQTVLFGSDPDSSMSVSQKQTKTNWQAVADMIITRYSDFLYHLAFDHSLSNKSDIDSHIGLILRPFIDSDNRNLTIEVDRCMTHFLPPIYSNTTAAKAVRHVSNMICTTLFTILELLPSSSSPNSFDHARQVLQDLVHHLKWTTWKECRPGCTYDQICFTAIWPYGDTIDHETPSCLNGTQMAARRGSYWRGDFLGPGNGKDGQDRKPPPPPI